MKLELEDIRRLDIRPGQILVATLPEGATPQEADQVHEILKAKLPNGVNVLVKTSNADLMVLNPEQLTDDLLGTPDR